MNFHPKNEYKSLLISKIKLFKLPMLFFFHIFRGTLIGRQIILDDTCPIQETAGHFIQTGVSSNISQGRDKEQKIFKWYSSSKMFINWHTLIDPNALIKYYHHFFPMLGYLHNLLANKHEFQQIFLDFINFRVLYKFPVIWKGTWSILFNFVCNHFFF